MPSPSDKDALLERSKQRESELEEEITALPTDIATLDSQPTRAMRLQKESEDKYENLRAAFDEAAEHFVRLEQGEKSLPAREEELAAELAKAEEEIEGLSMRTLMTSQKVSEEQPNLAVQREEDLVRTKERTDVAVTELRGKAKVEVKQRSCHILMLMSKYLT